MKAVLLASTLGLTLLANTAVAAVSLEQSSLLRTASANVSLSQQVNTNEWQQTKFDAVEKAQRNSETNKGVRRIIR